LRSNRTPLEFLHHFRRVIREHHHNDDLAIRFRKILFQHAHDRLLDEALRGYTYRSAPLTKLCQIATPGKISIAPPRQEYKYVPLYRAFGTYGSAANRKGKHAACLIRPSISNARCRVVGFDAQNCLSLTGRH